MEILKFQAEYFCQLGLQINGLVDKGEFLTIDEVFEMAESETLVKWLDEKVNLFYWGEAEKRIMSMEFFALTNVIDPAGKMGIENNGLVLLSSFCFEFIQTPPSRTLADL